MIQKIKGKVALLGEPEYYNNESGGRMLLLHIGGKFPQDVPFYCYNDKISLLDLIEVGERVKIEFALRGRSYKKGEKTMYFSTNTIVSITSLDKIADRPKKTKGLVQQDDFYNNQL